MAYFLNVAVGAVLGFLSGLGVGGGSLLVLWLNTVIKMEPEDIRLVSLLFFLPSAAGASIIRFRKQKLDYGRVLPLTILGCAGALAGCYASRYLPVEILKKIFGVLLLYTGTTELKKGIQRFRKAR